MQNPKYSVMMKACRQLSVELVGLAVQISKVTITASLVHLPMHLPAAAKVMQPADCGGYCSKSNFIERQIDPSITGSYNLSLK